MSKQLTHAPKRRAKKAPARPARRARRVVPAHKRRGNPLIALRLEPDQIEALRLEATARGLTVSDLVRLGVSDVFDRRANEVIRRKESVSV